MLHFKFITSLLVLLAFCGIAHAQDSKWSGGSDRSVSTLHKEEGDGRFCSFSTWVKFSAKDDRFPCIASNKKWEKSKVISLLSSRNMGFSPESGKELGWALGIQPNGAWTWNVGDGKHRLDYLPTAEKQNVCDNKWHLIGFSIDRRNKIARLFFDGKNVAIYSMNHFRRGVFNGGCNIGCDRTTDIAGCDIKGVIKNATLLPKESSESQVFEIYRERFPNAKAVDLTRPVRKLKMLTWNIWHGARHPGIKKGIDQAVEFIESADADIITMQETYGSGPTIADRLGYRFYQRSDNLSIMSRFPIKDIHQLYRPLWFGGATIQLSDHQKMNVFCLWIHYLPAWGRDARKEGATAEALIEGEWKTRATEIKDILALIQPFIKSADQIPLVIGGDFNSPSMLDWGKDTADWHKGLKVKWPVSQQMLDQGFTDGFRSIHKDPSTFPKSDLWIGGAKKVSYRIDYLYSLGKGIKVKDADMMNTHKGVWSSDHPAVLVTYELAVPN